MPVDALWAKLRSCSSQAASADSCLVSPVQRCVLPARAPAHIVKWRQLCWASAAHLASIHGPINEPTQQDPKAKLTPNDLISDCVLSPPSFFNLSFPSPLPLLIPSISTRGKEVCGTVVTACTLESSENGHDQSTRPSRTCLSWLEGEVWESDIHQNLRCLLQFLPFNVQSELILIPILEVILLVPKSAYRLVN
jgi:hypothetical protein